MYKYMSLVRFAYPKLDVGGRLEFLYFPELLFLRTFNLFFRALFWVDSKKHTVLSRDYFTLKPNVQWLVYVFFTMAAILDFVKFGTLAIIRFR